MKLDPEFMPKLGPRYVNPVNIRIFSMDIKCRPNLWKFCEFIQSPKYMMHLNIYGNRGE